MSDRFSEWTKCVTIVQFAGLTLVQKPTNAIHLEPFLSQSDIVFPFNGVSVKSQTLSAWTSVQMMDYLERAKLIAAARNTDEESMIYAKGIHACISCTIVLLNLTHASVTSPVESFKCIYFRLESASCFALSLSFRNIFVIVLWYWLIILKCMGRRLCQWLMIMLDCFNVPKYCHLCDNSSTTANKNTFDSNAKHLCKSISP